MPPRGAADRYLEKTKELDQPPSIVIHIAAPRLNTNDLHSLRARPANYLLLIDSETRSNNRRPARAPRALRRFRRGIGGGSGKRSEREVLTSDSRRPDDDHYEQEGDAAGGDDGDRVATGGGDVVRVTQLRCRVLLVQLGVVWRELSVPRLGLDDPRHGDVVGHVRRVGCWRRCLLLGMDHRQRLDVLVAGEAAAVNDRCAVLIPDLSDDLRRRDPSSRNSRSPFSRRIYRENSDSGSRWGCDGK